MNFDAALKYVRDNELTASYISKNSSISISAARRMIKGDTIPHEETKLALIEFVKSHIDSLQSNDDFLEKLEAMVDENFEKLMERPSFRKTIHIEVLKIFIKAQAKSTSNKIDVETLSNTMNE